VYKKTEEDVNFLQGMLPVSIHPFLRKN